jgi:glycosyltransferase involved in cell wall biosynthesis
MSSVAARPPQVSVCIPTYNYARFLPEAIESILRQHFTDFELLIIDDGSADDTTAVVQRYAAKDPRIRYLVNSPNVGMVNNWNLCLREARGEFIKFVFGDDWLTSPNCLQTLLAPLLADPTISLVASGRHLVDEHSQIIRTRSSFPKPTIIPGHRIIRQCLEEHKNLIGEPTVVLFRKKAATRGFNPAYRQIVDLEMWCHLLEQGDLAYFPEPLCAFRCHPDQQTEHNRRSTATLDDAQLLLAEYLPKPYLNFGSMTQRLIRFNYCYQVWKARRKQQVSQAYTEATINDHFGYGRFRLLLPGYKIIRPLLKLCRHLTRKVGTREIHFGKASSPV